MFLNRADACRVNRIVHPHRQRGNNRATAPFPCHRRHICLRARRMSRKCAAGQAVYTEGLLPYPPGDNPWARHGRAVLHRLRRHSWCVHTASTHVACCTLFLHRPSEVVPGASTTRAELEVYRHRQRLVALGSEKYGVGVAERPCSCDRLCLALCGAFQYQH